MLCAEFLRFTYLGPLFAHSRYAATPFTSLSSRNGLLDLFVNLCLGSVEISTPSFHSPPVTITIVPQTKAVIVVSGYMIHVDRCR